MWPFTRKPAWAVQYAQSLYDGLVADNDGGSVTALALRIPTALHPAYETKILLQRELMALVAISESAVGDRDLQPVMLAFGKLVVSQCAARGLQWSLDQLVEYAFRDVEKLRADPVPWAQQWLAEFRDNPDDTFMAAAFADHCRKLHDAYKAAIANTRRR